MRLKLKKAALAMLADFLDAEYKKRLMIDRGFSLRSWAKEIGVNHVTLSHWMNRKSKADPDLSAKNFNALQSYFGKPFLDSIGVEPLTTKPRNPLYGK